MSDFYADPVPTTRVVVPRFAPPPRITVGPDGIPDYVEATKGAPHEYLAPPGYRLAIYHNGVRLKHIVIADRVRGFAIGRHYRERGWDVDFLPYDENGVTQERFYEGVITFKLIFGPGPKVFGLRG